MFSLNNPTSHGWCLPAQQQQQYWKDALAPLHMRKGGLSHDYPSAKGTIVLPNSSSSSLNSLTTHDESMSSILL